MSPLFRVESIGLGEICGWRALYITLSPKVIDLKTNSKSEPHSRCHRLGKSCSSQTPAPPRKRKEPKPTRVAELERRIEDLTALVGSTQQLIPSATNSDGHRPPDPAAAFLNTDLPAATIDGSPPFSQPPRPDPLGLGHLFPGGGAIFGGSVDQTQRHLYQHQYPAYISNSTTSNQSTSPEAKSSPETHQSQQGDLWPEGDEAEELLCEYRSHMGHLFPFAVVPPTTLAAALQKQKPFLWKAFMVEAYHHDGLRQIALGEKLLQDISEAAFMRSQSSLDLLQGTQVLVAWLVQLCHHIDTIVLTWQVSL